MSCRRGIALDDLIDGHLLLGQRGRRRVHTAMLAATAASIGAAAFALAATAPLSGDARCRFASTLTLTLSRLPSVSEPELTSVAPPVGAVVPVSAVPGVPWPIELVWSEVAVASPTMP